MIPERHARGRVDRDAGKEREHEKDGDAAHGGSMLRCAVTPVKPIGHGLAESNVCSILIDHARRLPRRAVPFGAQPGERDGLPVEPQPVHGLRASLCLLLRARFRAPRRPPVRRSLRDEPSGQDQRRRGAPRGAPSPVAGGGRRWRSARPPIRTSRPRAATG